MARRQTSLRWCAWFVATGLTLCLASAAWGQNAVPPSIDGGPPLVGSPSSQPAATASDTTTLPTPLVRAKLNVFDLIYRCGWMMVPILLASVLTVALVVERFISLRQEKVLPSELMNGVFNFDESFDPRQAYRLCQSHPSPAAAVIRTMLLKVGRPHSEVERAISEASNREANRLYDNVRWLNLIAAVAPLLGLLGTVWGMIKAFYVTTQLQPGQNKADFLADGIYLALVTTLGGLIVAIPAAIFAHYFEGRIQTLFHRMEEMIFQLLPHIEPYEGRVRVTPQGKDGVKAVSNGDDATKSSPVPR